jgi:hypothetical protein
MSEKVRKRTEESFGWDNRLTKTEFIGAANKVFKVTLRNRWRDLRDSVTVTLNVIRPGDSRVLGKAGYKKIFI